MSVSRSRCVLLCNLVLLACCSAKVEQPQQKLKILGIFGHQGNSHFAVFKPLLEELGRRGHELTVISYFPRTEKAKAEEPLPNYKDISLVGNKPQNSINIIDLHGIYKPKYKIFGDLLLLNNMAYDACENSLKNPRVKEFLASGEKFDLVITESFNTRCLFVLFHKQGVPFIEVTTHQPMSWMFHDLGFSSEASYRPCILSVLPKPMNFTGRMWNVFYDLLSAIVGTTLFPWRDQNLMRKYYGSNTPDLKAMAGNASAVLVGTHFSLHGPQPLPPNVVEVGGIHIPKKINPLPQDVKKFLDEAHEGVLYFNLGSMVKTASMPKDKLTVVLNVLTSFPRKVIWKWETDDLPMKLDNVLVKKWLNQFDIMSE